MNLGEMFDKFAPTTFKRLMVWVLALGLLFSFTNAIGLTDTNPPEDKPTREFDYDQWKGCVDTGLFDESYCTQEAWE